jgi:endonuclease/exonuclease/phosphatase (EEP) superfamily protein YafD
MSETEVDRVRAGSGRGLIVLVLIGLTLASVLSFAGALWWVLDLLSHFHAIYFWVAVAVGVATAVLRWWKLAGWAAALVLLEVTLLLPLYAGGEDPSPGSPRLRVVSYNMLHGNPGTVEAAAHIAGLEPDVVVLLELTPEQLPVFTAALPGWHHVARPRGDAFGIAVFTREAPSRMGLLDLGPAAMPSIEVEYEVDGRAVAIAAVHPPPPVSAGLSGMRDGMLRAISKWAAEQEGPVLVVGDLNATPWSVVMREILDEGPLRSTQRFGLQATWPSVLGPLGVPIDHALVAGPLEPVMRTIAPAFGSDHRMLVVDLELRG